MNFRTALPQTPLTTLSPDIDLLPIVASPAQQQLESLFLNWLNIFHYVPRESNYSGGERIRIDRVRSGPDHLVLSLDPITTLWHLSSQVMPVSHSDDVDGVYHISGVPGLRVKDDSLGVCLYRPGIQARIILAGISSHEWESSHHDGFVLPHNTVGCLSTMFPNDWTESEREAEHFHGIERDEIASIESTLLRRILLLTRLKPTGVNTWRTPLRGVSVELIFEEFTREDFEEILSTVTSSSLVPRMLLKSQSVDTAAQHGSIRLHHPGTENILDIRIMANNPRTLRP